MKRIIYLTLILFVLSSCDKEKNYLRDGNKEFKDKQYSEAETYFRKALSIDSTYEKAQYNLANSTYKQNKETQYGNAIMYYNKALAKDSIADTNFVANVLYNRGNANFKLALMDSASKSEKYNDGLKKAVEDYKKSLKLNMKDSSARYNLALAMHLLKQNKNNNQNKNKQKQDQQNQQQQQKQNQKDKKDNKDNQKNNQQNQNQQNKDKNDKGNKGQDQLKSQKQQDNNRMLEALKNNEKNTLERLRKEKDNNAKQNRNAKDW